jgi:hypothetical protein
MFRNHARKLVVALALCAVAGASVPGSNAAAAPIRGVTSADEVRWNVEQTEPVVPPFVQRKMSVQVLSPVRVGLDTFYRFRIQMEQGTAKHITAKTRHMFGTNAPAVQPDADSPWQEQAVAETLSAPDYRDVTVYCHPQHLMYCSGARIQVENSNHSDVWSVDYTDGNRP